MSTRLPPLLPVSGFTLAGAGLSGASTGVKLSYTCPVGRQAEVIFLGVAGFVLAPTLRLRAVIGGATVVIGQTTQANLLENTLCLQQGDSVEISVQTAVAGSSFDGCLVVKEYATGE